MNHTSVADNRRPRSYSARRRYTPSPVQPPPSRRSLPDFNRNNGDYTYRERDNYQQPFYGDNKGEVNYQQPLYGDNEGTVNYAYLKYKRSIKVYYIMIRLNQICKADQRIIVRSVLKNVMKKVKDALHYVCNLTKVSS